MPLLKENKNCCNPWTCVRKRRSIKKMMLAGTNVFRINFSHADHSDVAERIQIIRKLSQELNYIYPY